MVVLRSTEGVWMSVTPTDDALIVALDFEGLFDYLQSYQGRLITQFVGVDSVERSLQEDTLLVLFNTAISNLVCQLCPGRDSLLKSNRSCSAIILHSVGTSADYSSRSNLVHPYWIQPLTQLCSNPPSSLLSRQVSRDNVPSSSFDSFH